MKVDEIKKSTTVGKPCTAHDIVDDVKSQKEYDTGDEITYVSPVEIVFGLERRLTEAGKPAFLLALEGGLDPQVYAITFQGTGYLKIRITWL